MRPGGKLMSKWKIDMWIDECAMKPIRAFSPSAINKDLNIDVATIFERLLKLTEDDKLILSWRIICPDCFRQIGIYENQNIIPRYVECMECGERETTKDMIYPLFSIKDDYKKELMSQKKTSKPCQSLVFARAKSKFQMCH